MDGPHPMEILLGFLACFMLGAGVGKCAADNNWQDLTVDAGAAEYYLDTDNERQWRWRAKDN